MKQLTLLTFFSLLSTILCGQTLADKTGRLTFDQNEIWLAKIKPLDKHEQWTAIKQRLLYPSNSQEKNDSTIYSPMIIVNGIPLLVPDTLSEKSSDKLLALFSDMTISRIDIIDKKPDKWTFHKPFSGVIILTVDKTK